LKICWEWWLIRHLKRRLNANPTNSKSSIMRWLIFVLLCPLFSFGQKLYLTKDTIDMKIMVEQTKYIMNRLQIGIRKNIHKDDSLKISTYSSPKLISAAYGQDFMWPYSNSKGLDTLGRAYKNPNIIMSELMDSILKNRIDTTKFVRVKAHSSILHELTHYLQITYTSDDDYIPATLEGFRDYVLQPTEFEAYAVDSYFTLYLLNRKELDRIMKMQTTRNERFKMLINAYFDLVYPQIPKL
jgi:hypothetical protein